MFLSIDSGRIFYSTRNCSAAAVRLKSAARPNFACGRIITVFRPQKVLKQRLGKEHDKCLPNERDNWVFKVVHIFMSCIITGKFTVMKTMACVIIFNHAAAFLQL